MNSKKNDRFSAKEPGLGYLYQPRLALLKMFELSEQAVLYIEKEDDIDFKDSSEINSLMSLKHKTKGNKLTNLSLDFWKSVRIWLTRYNDKGQCLSNLRFFLFTTEKVSDSSFLKFFLTDFSLSNDKIEQLSEKIEESLNTTESKLIIEIRDEYNELSDINKIDFLSRIQIFDNSPRIENIPEIIKNKHMRSIRREHRESILERLEGWWNNEIIKLLSGSRENGMSGYELSDKLFNISEEYKNDNLPITFRGKLPNQKIDVKEDSRLFVIQLKEIGISSNRIHNAIIDYYRAFEQRSEWARSSLLILGELADYEDRLIEEWERYRDFVFENLDDDSADDIIKEAGKSLYDWADQKSGNYESLRIRARVTESYVIRGSYHLLADNQPLPRVYWHPLFLKNITTILEEFK